MEFKFTDELSETFPIVLMRAIRSLPEGHELIDSFSVISNGLITVHMFTIERE